MVHIGLILWIRRLMDKATVIISFAKETIREKMYRLTGSDILRCPRCLQGTMTFHVRRRKVQQQHFACPHQSSHSKKLLFTSYIQGVIN